MTYYFKAKSSGRVYSSDNQSTWEGAEYEPLKAKAGALAIQEQARDDLRKIIPPGSTVTCILRHVSRSGMFRIIALCICENGEPRDISYLAGMATGIGYDRDRSGLKMGGCGMDMGFAAVYDLSRSLYRDKFQCIGEKCPSNDHSNGDRERAPHAHSDGGYALRHRWL